jgi:glycosyltransferase involved in cell wall biosynthesis
VKKKKILIDATLVVGVPDGLSTYIENLLKHLPKESFNEFEYSVLMTTRRWKRSDPGSAARPPLRSLLDHLGMEVIYAPIAAIGPQRDVDMARFLIKHQRCFDLVHITTSNYPLALKNGVCTVHDLGFKEGALIDEPWYYFGAKTAYMDIVYRSMIKKARRVIADSHYTKAALDRFYGLTPQQHAKTSVVHLGWEHVKELAQDANYSDKLPPSNRYLFYLGTYRQHKNLGNLLEGFKISLNHIPSDVALVAGGYSRHGLDKFAGVLESINQNGKRAHLTGYIPDAVIGEYFRLADAYIMPSLVEGFGIPILEAFYHGCPVLCSNACSLPEVAGDAAIYFDPYRPEDIAEAIIRFYNDPGAGPMLIMKGHQQLNKFSWSKTAAETVDVYRQSLRAEG